MSRHAGKTTSSLQYAIDEQPAPPCEQFKCPEIKRCAKLGLACQAYVEYLNCRPIRAPRLSEPKERPTARKFDEVGLVMPTTKRTVTAA